jgi:hypothetical protein
MADPTRVHLLIYVAPSWCIWSRKEVRLQPCSPTPRSIPSPRSRASSFTPSAGVLTWLVCPTLCGEAALTRRSLSCTSTSTSSGPQALASTSSTPTILITRASWPGRCAPIVIAVEGRVLVHGVHYWLVPSCSPSPSHSPSPTPNPSPTPLSYSPLPLTLMLPLPLPLPLPLNPQPQPHPLPSSSRTPVPSPRLQTLQPPPLPPDHHLQIGAAGRERVTGLAARRRAAAPEV